MIVDVDNIGSLLNTRNPKAMRDPRSKHAEALIIASRNDVGRYRELSMNCDRGLKVMRRLTRKLRAHTGFWPCYSINRPYYGAILVHFGGHTVLIDADGTIRRPDWGHPPAYYTEKRRLMMEDTGAL